MFKFMNILKIKIMSMYSHSPSKAMCVDILFLVSLRE